MLEYADGGSLEVTGKQALVLGMLAVRPGEYVPRPTLLAVAWPRESVEPKRLNDVLKALRKYGVTIPNAVRNGDAYRLDCDRAQVDAVQLSDAVPDLAAFGEAAQIDELLSLCRGEPGDFVGAHWWRTVKKARDELVTAVLGLPAVERATLKHLDEFVDRNPEAANRLRAHLDHEVAPVRKRILIVEDHPTLGRTIEATLSPLYECVLITRYDQWLDLVESGVPYFDGALVDRHLEQDGRDNHGLDVLLYLKMNGGVPSILMTVDPPFKFQQDARTEYGVIDVYRKGDEHVSALELVNRLFGALHAEA